MNGRAWTQAEVQRLIDLAVEGLHAEAIGTAIGRPRYSVKSKAKELGLQLARKRRLVAGTMPEWTPEEDRQLEFFCERSPRFLARKLGRSVRAVRARASRLGIRFGQGLVTVQEVADLLGVGPKTVRQHLDALGVTKRQAVPGRRKLKDRRGLEVEEVEAVAKAVLEDPRAGRSTTIARLKAVASGELGPVGLSERLAIGRAAARRAAEPG